MIRNFSSAVVKNEKRPQWTREAMLTQRVLDALFTSAKQGGVMVSVQQE